MAGAGYKLFVSGDVLTAAQVNTYLNEQTVMVFATSAARTSALSAVLAEGMMSYLQDSNTVYYYDGTAWNALASGDITAITAGNGISVTSGTGPVPTVAIDTAVTVDKTTAQTLTNKTLTSPALTTPTISTLTTNGDLVYGTGSGALSRLGIGSSAQVLTVASGVPSWATPAGGGGKVLQVVFGSTATPSTNTTITFADTGITATITPTLATSKVMILWVADVYHSATTDNAVSYRLLRASTSIQNNNDAGLIWFQSVSQGANFQIVNNYLDSPATTSATTYKVQLRNYLSPGSLTVSNTASSVATSTIMLLEIGA